MAIRTFCVHRRRDVRVISDPAVYPPVEKALGINISDYALEKEHR
jgi:hypothetical protein